MLIVPTSEFGEIVSKQVGGTGYRCEASVEQDGGRIVDWEHELSELSFFSREAAQREFEQCGLTWSGTPKLFGARTLDIPSADYETRITLKRQRVYSACAVDDRQELIAMIQSMARVPFDRFGAGRIWGDGGEPGIMQARSSKAPRLVLIDSDRPRLHFIGAWYFFHEKAPAA